MYVYRKFVRENKSAQKLLIQIPLSTELIPQNTTSELEVDPQGKGGKPGKRILVANQSK